MVSSIQRIQDTSGSALQISMCCIVLTSVNDGLLHDRHAAACLDNDGDVCKC
jgi:hypothetical protein